jgi:ribonuclease HI
MICLFTDGSSLTNPGKAGSGVAVVYNGILIYYIGIPIEHGTNNVAELTAAIYALKLAKAYHEQLPDERIVLVADSNYVLKGIPKCDIWMLPEEERPNRELWEQCYEALLGVGTRVVLKWVHGHRGYPTNELCDKLAKAAAQSQEVIEWTRT